MTYRSIAFLEHDAQIGGAEVNVLEMIPYLLSRGWEPIVICPFSGPLVDAVTRQGGKAVILPMHRFASTSTCLGNWKFFNPFNTIYNVLIFIPTIWRLSRFLRQQEIQVVHTNTLLAHLFGGIACRLARVPCIWHVQDIVDPGLAMGLMRRIFSDLGRWLPDRIVVISQAVSAMFPTDPARVIVIPNGVDLDVYTPDLDGAPVREEYGIPPHAPLVGIVGRLTPWKGHKVFLEAASKVLDRFPDAYFLIVGDTAFEKASYREELEDYTEQLGLEKRAIFTGFRKDTPRVMSALDISVLASIKPEPFGRVIIEAMALAKPVVATNQGGAPEIIIEGVSGVLIPPGDSDAMAEAINDLLADPDKRSRIGKAARERVEERFSLKVFCQMVEDLYISVCKVSKESR